MVNLEFRTSGLILSTDSVILDLHIGACLNKVNNYDLSRTFFVCKLLTSRLLPWDTKLGIYLLKIVPVSSIAVLYGSKTWYLTLSYEVTFKILENKVLTDIYGGVPNEDIEEDRQRYYCQLQDLYGRPGIVRILNSCKKI